MEDRALRTTSIDAAIRPGYSIAMRLRRAALILTLATAACSAKISATIQVDDAPFAPTDCRSGQALGFSGIELIDANGRHLRLMAQADGSTSVALFAADAPRGDLLGPCGTLVMHAQNSRINSITNLEGTASLDCQAVGHKVTGKVDFANCH